MFPGAMPTKASKEERQLIKLFKKLENPDKKTLLDFAEFLFARSETSAIDESEISSDNAKKAIPSEPLSIPRPEDESVIKAIKRLSKNYPMVDKETILHPISGLMTSHIMQGKEAVKVIDELETLFLEQYNSLNETNNKS